MRKGAYSDLGRKGNHRSQGVRENMPRTAGTHLEGPKKSAYGLGLIGKGVMADSRQKKRPLAWMVSEAALPPGSTEPSSTLPLRSLTSAARTQLLSSSRKPGFSPSRPPRRHSTPAKVVGAGGAANDRRPRGLAPQRQPARPLGADLRRRLLPGRRRLPSRTQRALCQRAVSDSARTLSSGRSGRSAPNSLVPHSYPLPNPDPSVLGKTCVS